MTDRTLLAIAQVALRLNVSAENFNRRRRELIERHGFPPPLPGLALRWDPLAIDLWLDKHIPPPLRIPPSEDATLAAQRATLEQRLANAPGLDPEVDRRRPVTH